MFEYYNVELARMLIELLYLYQRPQVFVQLIKILKLKDWTL